MYPTDVSYENLQKSIQSEIVVVYVPSTHTHTPKDGQFSQYVWIGESHWGHYGNIVCCRNLIVKITVTIRN